MEEASETAGNGNPNGGQRRGGRRKNGRVTDSNSQLLVIDPEKVRTDPRTTLMIRNIPNRWVKNYGIKTSFTQEVLLKIVNGYIKNRYDFFYLPIDFHTQCNLGYCYINVVDVATVLDLYNNVILISSSLSSFITNTGLILLHRKHVRFVMLAFRLEWWWWVSLREWIRCWSIVKIGLSCIYQSSSVLCSMNVLLK